MRPVKAYPGEPAEINIKLVRNDTMMLKFRGWSNTGEPYNFNGHTFRMHIKTSRKCESEILVDVPNEDFHIDQDEIGEPFGRYNILFIRHASENMDIPAGKYVFDIEMTDGMGNVQTIFKEKDTLIVTDDVNK